MSSHLVNPEHFGAIKAAIESRNCIAFIGSGFSRGIYPSWKVLIKSICEACDVGFEEKEAENPDYLLDAAEAALQRNPERYYSTLGNAFGRICNTNPVYRAIFEIGFKSIITVNFDPLLQQECRVPHSSWSLRCYPDLDLGIINNRTVYYIHGLIREKEIPGPNSIVLARSEFDRAYKDPDFGETRTFLVEALKRNEICFLGCGLAEPTLPRVFEICKKQQQAIRDRSGRGGETPLRFILLPALEGHLGLDVDSTSAQQTLEQMKDSEDRHFADFDILVYRYHPRDAQYSGLRHLLEELAQYRPADLCLFQER